MKDFIVCGLGESIQELKRSSGDGITSIGCNDIYKIVPTDYIVCVDPKSVFNADRLKTIRSSTPRKFFSFLPEWEEDFIGRFELMERNKPRSVLTNLDDVSKVCYSITSPFVACVKAYQLGAKRIVMYGVDFNSHATMLKPHKQEIIKRDFTNLFEELKKRKVELIVGSKQSFLSGFLPVQHHHQPAH